MFGDGANEANEANERGKGEAIRNVSESGGESVTGGRKIASGKGSASTKGKEDANSSAEWFQMYLSLLPIRIRVRIDHIHGQRTGVIHIRNRVIHIEHTIIII